jgi:mono/diheme cytochrome c family protein
MRPVWFGIAATAWVVSALTMNAAQGTPGGRGGAAAGPPPAVVPVSGRPPVDQVAHDRGRAVWAHECIDCHGSQARGSEKGPNIIRTKTVNFDRSSQSPGSVLRPFLQAGHPTMSARASASFTPDEVVGLAHFLRQRVNDTMRGSPLFTVGDILVGDRAAGEAFFNGAGRCAACHTSTSFSLAGIGSRVPAPVDIQQRMMFPGGAPRGRGAAPAANPNVITATITPEAGPEISGALVEQSNFFVTLRLPDGTVRAIRRTPGMKVVLVNPLQAHIDLLEVITDGQMHDLVAYLESLK